MNKTIRYAEFIQDTKTHKCVSETFFIQVHMHKKTCTYTALFDTSVRILKDKKAHCKLLLTEGGMDPHIKHFSGIHELSSLSLGWPAKKLPFCAGQKLCWNDKALHCH